jgi:flagellar biosynthesis protein FliR
MGLDRQVLLAFSNSLSVYPPGSFVITKPMAEQILHLGSTIFVTGFRLVLPVVALLIMVDLALALLGRLNAHLQLMTLIFPAKILTSLALLASILVLYPKVYSQHASGILNFVRALVHLPQ